ncbi:hypothetical protein AA0323_0916 [Asaia siamensis NRIC 0323]|nr:hypothetical protein AA0323_0916 [Asaia siamensis NRIC 0323]
MTDTAMIVAQVMRNCITQAHLAAFDSKSGEGDVEDLAHRAQLKERIWRDRAMICPRGEPHSVKMMNAILGYANHKTWYVIAADQRRKGSLDLVLNIISLCRRRKGQTTTDQ